MRKILIILLLLVLHGICVKYLENGMNTAYIFTNYYTAVFSKNLENGVLVTNMYNISVVPKIIVGTKEVVPTLFVGNTQTSFSDKIAFSGMQIEDEVEYITTVEFKEDLIVSRLSVRNLGVNTKSFEVIFSVESKEPFVIFYPTLYYGEEKNYLVVTQSDLKGISLGIKFNYPVTQENFQKTFSMFKKEKNISFRFQNLKNNEKFEIEMVFVPFCIGDASLKQPEYTCLLRNEKLYDLPKTPNIVGNSQGILTLVQKERIKSETFTNFRDIAGSLKRALYGKSLCIHSKLPCRLIIGKKADGLVAWLSVLDSGWKEIDLYRISYQRPPVGEILYEEPLMKYVGSISGNDYTTLTKITAWVETAGEKNLLIPVIFIIVVTVVILFLINRYGRKYIEYLSSESPVRRVYLDGKYEIISEPEDPNIVLKEIYEWVKQHHGEVNLKRMEVELRYSEEIIKSWLIYLIRKGHIKKI